MVCDVFAVSWRDAGFLHAEGPCFPPEQVCQSTSYLLYPSTKPPEKDGTVEHTCDSTGFNIFIGEIIILNALTMGIETEVRARGLGARVAWCVIAVAL